jgi:aminoglycoside phosphotransferase (APT) family kinase protein
VAAPDPLAAGKVLAEAGESVRPRDVSIAPLPGGASREAWVLQAGERRYVLKRDPLDEVEPWSARAREFAAARAAYEAGVPTARPIAFEPAGGRFVSAALIAEWVEGTSSPRRILADVSDRDTLLRDIGRAAGQLARIDPGPVLGEPVPRDAHAAIVASFAADLEELAPDRPVLALGIRWLELHRPSPRRAVLAHGDFRVGNVMVDAQGRLAALIDWEFARAGDAATDLGFFSLRPWRYGRDERRAGGLGAIEPLLEGYAAVAPTPLEPAHLRIGEIAGQVWWGLYCLRHSQAYLAGRHRSLERLVLGRRIAEVEQDLLDLIEADA